MAKKQTAENNDLIAFEEEKENLAVVEDSIHTIASEKKSRLDRLKEEIDDFYVGDSEDLQNKQYLMEERNSLWNDYDAFMEYEDSPYFGHFDMISGQKETQVYFVGKQGLEHDGEIVILDWRSPMGNTFYNKREHKFSVKGIDYELLLRRAVNIQKATLISVNTEYDSVNLSLEGEVIDPFLISVLKDKRRNYRLTDIIRTIQMNQNDIIGKAIDKSFIVQGCAGSGKTMILLHRLSFIAFNHPEVNFNKVCIITPNDNFNIHVDDLSKSLGLDKVKRYTVESFYAELINTRSRGDLSQLSNGKRVPRFTASADGIQSEKLLNNEMLAYIYSEDYMNSICKEYKEKIDNAIALLNTDEVWTCISEKAGLSDRINGIDYVAYEKTVNAIERAFTAHKANYSEYQNALQKHPEAQMNFDSANVDLSSQKEILSNTRDALIATLKSEQFRLETDFTESEVRLKSLNDEIATTKKEKAKAFEEVKSAERKLSSYRTNKDRLQEREFLFSTNDFAVLIRENFPEECNKIESLYAQLDKLAIYNFGKRSRLRADISSAQNQLLEGATTIIVNQEHNIEDEVVALRARIGELDTQITDANAAIADIQTQDKRDVPVLNAIQACLKLFETEEFPNLGMKSSFAADKKILSSFVLDYDREYRRYLDASLRFNTVSDTLNKINGAIDVCKKKILDDKEFSLLEKVQTTIGQFSITTLYKGIENNLRSIYKKYNQPYSSRTNYRHRLYLKLLLASLYYGPAANNGYYVNIDEAQDLSVSEYKLLRNILGIKTVFNLYGDVNQSVYEYKGISDWDEIADVISDNVYFLNENYRNTVEITNYCNNKFEADVTAVGLSGAAVVSDSFDVCLDALVSIYKDDTAKRVAIIYRRGLSDIENLLSSRKDCKFVFNTIANSGISVITVEEAKGLEFDAVMVVENYMSVNEQYVSYTRALDELYITSIADSHFEDFVEEEVVDDIETEAEAVSISEEDDIANAPIADEPPEVVANNNLQLSLELGVEPEDISYEQWKDYIQTFFRQSEELAKSFEVIANHVRSGNKDMLLRVSAQYIGFAKANEKTRMYVAQAKDGYVIKFKHLYANEPFDAAKADQYCRLYNQCEQYISKVPTSVLMNRKKV